MSYNDSNHDESDRDCCMHFVFKGKSLVVACCDSGLGCCMCFFALQGKLSYNNNDLEESDCYSELQLFF